MHIHSTLLPLFSENWTKWHNKHLDVAPLLATVAIWISSWINCPVWCDAQLWYWLYGQKFIYNHELDGAADPSGSLSKIIWQRFSMYVATSRYRISECLLSSTAANSSIYFCSSCQKGSNAGFFGWPLSFLKSHNKSVSFDSRIKLTRYLSTASSFWLELALSSSVVKQ